MCVTNELKEANMATAHEHFYFTIHLLKKCGGGGRSLVKFWENVCPTNAASCGHESRLCPLAVGWTLREHTERCMCPASDDDLTSWSTTEAAATGALWCFDSAKSMGDDLVNSRRSYSLLLRWGEMASPAGVEAELMKELLS